MLSDSISDRTLLLLFLDAVEFFAALNNTCISARTLLLLLLYNSYIHCADGYVAAKLMCRLICNLPELNIRIFQSAYFLFF